MTFILQIIGRVKADPDYMPRTSVSYPVLLAYVNTRIYIGLDELIFCFTLGVSQFPFCF